MPCRIRSIARQAAEQGIAVPPWEAIDTAVLTEPEELANALTRIAKDGEAGEDDVRRAEKELDHLTEQHVHGIDEAMKNKESELLEV